MISGNLRRPLARTSFQSCTALAGAYQISARLCAFPAVAFAARYLTSGFFKGWRGADYSTSLITSRLFQAADLLAVCLWHGFFLEGPPAGRGGVWRGRAP